MREHNLKLEETRYIVICIYKCYTFLPNSMTVTNDLHSVFKIVGSLIYNLLLFKCWFASCLSQTGTLPNGCWKCSIVKVQSVQIDGTKASERLMLIIWYHCKQVVQLTCCYFFPFSSVISFSRLSDKIHFKVLLWSKKFTTPFPSDFKRVFVWLFTGKILSFEFYSKAVFFECKCRISWSAIVHV